MIMIKLFHQQDYIINTADFSHLLHDKVVTDFEQRFAEYVGARYAVSFNSATSALFLICNKLIDKKSYQFKIPSIIPPVVPNAIINAGVEFEFIDCTTWVGHDYEMGYYDLDNQRGRIIDSAQKVEKDQYNKLRLKNIDLILYSFFPTKPVGSIDGGMVVTNDRVIADALRVYSMNGMTAGINSWERQLVTPGHKMYMNSIQAYIANENLSRLEILNNDKLDCLRILYNKEFPNTYNSSRHLYCILVPDQPHFIKKAVEQGITCGIHYKAAHLEECFGQQHLHLPLSAFHSQHTVSIPFHPQLTAREIEKVIHFVKENAF